MRTLILEDEEPSIAILRDYCNRHPRLAGRFDIVRSGTEAIERLNKESYDLFLSDISLPDMTGLDVVRNAKHVPPVVFSTGYPEHAASAFEVGAADFLVKPYDYARFVKSVTRVLSVSQPAGGAQKQDLRSIGVSVRNGENYFFIPFREIVYVTSAGKKSILHTIRSEFPTSQLLMQLEEKLPAPDFLRVHKQFILNLNYISHIQHMAKGDYMAFLKDEDHSQIPVSRNFTPVLRRRLGLE